MTLVGRLAGAEEVGLLGLFRGEDAPADSRWRVLIQSGCREGAELSRVWDTLKKEES